MYFNQMMQQTYLAAGLVLPNVQGVIGPLVGSEAPDIMEA